MRRKILPLSFFIVSTVFLASCKNDAYLAEAPGIPNQSFTEDFETISGAQANGWQFINASSPTGTGGWASPVLSAFIPGSTTLFTIPVFSGSGYVASPNTVAQGSSGYSVESTISNWVVSKPVWLQNGDKIVFFSNSISIDNTPSGLEVRMNRLNDGINVGSGNDPGDFKDVLTAINPFQSYNASNSYPTGWTRFEAVVGGLSVPVKGRIAFRYYVPDNYQYNDTTTIVAVDKMAYIGKTN
jgi:hypothetical protein